MPQVSIDRVITAWLHAELNSQRFGKEIHAIIKKQNLCEQQLFHPAEKKAREELLYAYRPYLEEDEIFGKFIWYEEEWPITIALSRLKYMDYSYWDEISEHTGDPRIAAQTIENGIKIFGVENTRFHDAARSWEKGEKFPPLITLFHEDSWTLLEGHLRLTALALAEKKTKNLDQRRISIIVGLK